MKPSIMKNEPDLDYFFAKVTWVGTVRGVGAFFYLANKAMHNKQLQPLKSEATLTRLEMKMNS